VTFESREELRDAHAASLAGDVFSMLRQENEIYVATLRTKMENADSEQQGWYAFAILMALQDLEGMRAAL
jgi:hypothetical protein